MARSASEKAAYRVMMSKMGMRRHLSRLRATIPATARTFGLSPKWKCDECGIPIPSNGRCEYCGRQYWSLDETARFGVADLSGYEMTIW